MKHRSHAMLVLAMGLALSACRQEAAGEATTTPAATEAAAGPAMPVAAGQQKPADQVLLDFRGKWWDAPEIPEGEQQRIAKLVDPAATADTQLTSRVDGAFTRADAREQAVILVPGGASTIDPFPAPATLAILEGDRVVARHAFGAEDGSWQWIRKAADIDGDGLQELFLTSGWMQMGESGTSLLVASLAGGNYRQVQAIENAVHSNCQAKSDQPGQGRAQALLLSLKAGQLSQERFEAPCPPAGDKAGSPDDPQPGDYKPVAG